MSTRFALSPELREHLRARGGRSTLTSALDAAIAQPELVTAASLPPQLTFLSLGAEATADGARLLMRFAEGRNPFLGGSLPRFFTNLGLPNIPTTVAYAIEPITFLVDGPGPGPAMRFGAGGGASIVDFSEWDFDADDLWSIEIWLRTTQAPGAPVTIVAKSNGTTWPFRLRLLAGGTVEGSRSDGANTPTVASTTPVNDGNWHYISLVKTAGTIAVQVDETAAVTAPDTVVTTTVNAATLDVGIGTLVADVADFGVYGTSLSPTQRTRHRLATLQTEVAA